MEMGQISLRMEINTLDSITTVIQMGLVSISGLMEIHMLDSSRMESSMERVNGARNRLMDSNLIISMKENMRMIRKTGMVNFNGNLVTDRKVITRRIKDKVMVRCSG